MGVFMQEQCASLGSEISRHEASTTALAAQLAALESQLADSRQHGKALESTLTETESELCGVTQQVRGARQEAAAMAERLQVAQAAQVWTLVGGVYIWSQAHQVTP